LSFSLVATLAYVVVTLVAGIRAHSLALLSEAGHNASDFLALLLSFAAVYFQTRPATDSKTFGYQRAGVLAAFINAATLLIISVWIGIEAVHRLSAPVAVQPRLMMIVAAAGVIMNGVIAALLWGVARDVNLRSAFLHMAGDTLSTAAVIVGGAGILFTGKNWIDPVLSLVIAALIFWSSLGIVRETLNILLEGTPHGCSLPEIRAGMEAVEGVVNVHDLHVWSLGSQSRALACHVCIPDIPPSESACILVNLNHVLKGHFGIVHATIQFEHVGCHELEGCVVPIEEMAAHEAGHHHGHSH
jgi:cobalt-zinc-cadmium efflux system protein